MRTEPRSAAVEFCRLRRRVARLVRVLCVTGLAVPGAARASKVQVGADTEVRSIDFSGVQDLQESQLRAVLQTQDRVSAFRLRSILGKVPLVPSPPRYPFHPRVLQEDVVRLRNKYAAEGFLGTQVRYEVERVGDQDLIDIRFVIEEGTPLRVVDVSVAAADSAASLPVPPEQREDWADMEKRARRLAGQRLDSKTLSEQRDTMRSWWCDRGFSQAKVGGHVTRDSLRGEARVRFVIDAGPRNRFGPIEVRGNQTVSEEVVRRELPFEPGDLYSDAALLDGRRNLQRLQIIRAVRVEVSQPGTSASTAGDSIAPTSDPGLPVVVTVTEGKPRLISGQLGYVTDAGISSEISWSHNNFTGGARVLTVSGLAQTGFLAVTDDPDLRYRGTVSLQQPHVIHRRMSAMLSPFVEYREDAQDRSLEVGSNVTLVFRPRQLYSVSLDYQISTRKIYEYRLEDLAAGNVDLLTFLTQIAEGGLDSLDSRVNTSLFTWSATASTLDDPTNPRVGVFVRPALQVTAPNAWSSAAYWRADCTVFGITPLTKRSALVGRVWGGRLFPYGKSLPSSDQSPTESTLQLRDASFTAGGSADVRGWDYRMLGPKFPDIRFEQEGDSVTTTADGYVALGAFSRFAFSLELRLPMPFFGPNLGSHVFLDGGQVWTDDSRFDSGSDRFGQEKFFYATGAGVHLMTPVGAIKLSFGYKLNPSLLDLVDSADLLLALRNETPTDQLDRHDSRRWQIHFAVGSSF